MRNGQDQDRDFRNDLEQFQSRSDEEVGPPPDGWPSLDCAALHGIAGDFVRLYAPHSEADVAALLVQFLTMAGSAIGRGPHSVVEATEHHLNLFVVLVGATAAGRKGTAYNRARQPFAAADPDWYQRCEVRSVGSGEGLIHAVRDLVIKDGQVVDEGITDKRCLLFESEFARDLKICHREGNVLSETFRQAWESGNLHNTIKNGRERATDAHISVIAHITEDELRRHLGTVEAANGFGNRFLWVSVRRSKFLPHGSNPEQAEVDAFNERLRQVLEEARKIGELRESDEEREAWQVIYRMLEARPPGLMGSLTQRASAQVLRLKALYATLEGSRTIETEHLMAALAVWEYAERSATFIFKDAMGDPVADRIMDALRDATGGLTRTEISSLFNRDKPSIAIRPALDNLLHAGRVAMQKSRAETGGRPKETFISISSFNSSNGYLQTVRALKLNSFHSLVQAVGGADRQNDLHD